MSQRSNTLLRGTTQASRLSSAVSTSRSYSRPATRLQASLSAGAKGKRKAGTAQLVHMTIRAAAERTRLSETPAARAYSHGELGVENSDNIKALGKRSRVFIPVVSSLSLAALHERPTLSKLKTAVSGEDATNAGMYVLDESGLSALYVDCEEAREDLGFLSLENRDIIMKSPSFSAPPFFASAAPYIDCPHPQHEYTAHVPICSTREHYPCLDFIHLTFHSSYPSLPGQPIEDPLTSPLPSF